MYLEPSNHLRLLKKHTLTVMTSISDGNLSNKLYISIKLANSLMLN